MKRFLIIALLVLSACTNNYSEKIKGSWYLVKEQTYDDDSGKKVVFGHSYFEFFFSDSTYFVSNERGASSFVTDYYVKKDSLYLKERNGKPYFGNQILQLDENLLRFESPKGEIIFYRIPNSEVSLADHYAYDSIQKRVRIKKDGKPYWESYAKRKEKAIEEFKKRDDD